MAAVATFWPSDLRYAATRPFAPGARRRRSSERAGTARRGDEAALDCIITMDHEGKILEFNPAAERTFGYRRADVLGAEMAEVIIPPALREVHRQGLAHYRATGASTMLGRRIDTTAMRADGSKFPIELAIARVPQPGPAVFIGYVRDLTSLAQEARISNALVRVGTEMLSLLDTARILDRLCVLTADVLGCDCSDSFLWEPRDDVYVWTSGHARGPESARARAGRRIPRTALASLLTCLKATADAGLALSASSRWPGAAARRRPARCTWRSARATRSRRAHRGLPHRSGAESASGGTAQTASMALNNARLVEGSSAPPISDFLDQVAELWTPLAALSATPNRQADSGARPPTSCGIRAMARTRWASKHARDGPGGGRAGRAALEAVRLRPFWETLAVQCGKMPRHAEVLFD
jgi:PAS domain S-box-containing protein